MFSSKKNKDILNLIKREPNKEKQNMLKEVYYNNLRYASTPKLVKSFKEIINAMIVVDRKFFVKKGEKYCYEDTPLPIGNNQTISQPTTVARMLLLSRLKPKMDVLEVGAGSGWNGSLTAFIVKPGKVLGVERIKPLAENAKNNLKQFKIKTKIKINAEFLHADALDKTSKIWKKKYDRIIVTAGVGPESLKKMREAGKDLLKENGLLLYPTNELGSYGALELWQKQKNKLKQVLREEGYSFVPLLRGK